MNKVILIGRVGKDVEYKTFDWGSVANFTLATTERWKNSEGQKKESTEWHNLVCNGNLATTAQTYVKKGDMINVVGKIKSRSYDDANGIKRSVTEIHISEIEFLSSKSSSNTSNHSAIEQSIPSIQDDDLPF